MKFDMLIMSIYPNSEEEKDGMTQRIKAIDKLISDKKRVYLHVSFRKNFKKKYNEIQENLLEYRLNYFYHYTEIVNLIKNANNIYIHSIYNAKILFFNSSLFEGKNIILDLHGVVPEELRYYGKLFKSKIFSKIEKEAIKTSNHVIFVTNKMKNYILSKYPKANFTSHILPIIPENLLSSKNIDIHKVDLLKKRLGINKDTVVFIYSGNAQKWQNIDLMLSTIKNIQNVPNYKFIILTGQKDIFKKKLEQHGIEIKNIHLESVSPENLAEYYYISNYGFILRDEHILNNVANPTKLVEYMYYGIIPIVKSENIGDYKDLGYEYVKIEDLALNMQPQKSIINKKIIENNILHIKNFDIKRILAGD